ncbi:unnamed protein product [Arabidopsis lyrata]|nr:unnamed protein product [Arabidopsis lyrata]
MGLLSSTQKRDKELILLVCTWGKTELHQQMVSSETVRDFHLFSFSFSRGKFQEITEGNEPCFFTTHFSWCKGIPSRRRQHYYLVHVLEILHACGLAVVTKDQGKVPAALFALTSAFNSSSGK